MAWWSKIFRRLRNRFIALVRAPRARRRFALEATWELLRARTQTLRHSRTYVRDLGVMGGNAPAADVRQIALAQEIGHMIQTVAKAMPFRALCLQQAIAARRMLDRRGIPATVHLGLSGAAPQPDAADVAMAAHAWVQTGQTVITGDEELEKYTVIASFG